ncbi:unnamed protein product, partial [Didymodactylos carnosus]
HIGSNINYTIEENEWRILAEKSGNYSDADIAMVVYEALLGPIRCLQQSIHFKRNPQLGGSDLWLPCLYFDPEGEALTLDKIDRNKLCKPSVTMVCQLFMINCQNFRQLHLG